MILVTKTEFLVGYTVRYLLPARHDCFIVRVWNPKTGASGAGMPGERDGRNFKITSDHEFLAHQRYHIEEACCLHECLFKIFAGALSRTKKTGSIIGVH